ncbi:tetratricopeptide repeat-containing diguanylate cyclase [Thalassotalea sp. PLHSN55]|uniref:tetratricopeptide repeat-containing diguanylate cyclase n=1 Tax=Thalassotalea sp. PLHSN55 TaxID=3435888 RepID=UPI003F865D57
MKTLTLTTKFLLVLLSLQIYSSFAQPAALALPSEDEINLEPWQNYQTLLTLEPNMANYSPEQQLSFLVQRAQAENLLYFYDKFEKSVAQMQPLIQKDTPIHLSSTVLFYAGIIAQRKTEYAKSVSLLKKSMEQAQEADLERIFVNAKQELAFTRSLTELYETSLVDLQESYLKAYAMDDQALIAAIYETYGATYGFMSEYEKSIEYHQKSLGIYQKLKFKAHIADTLYGIASTYRYWGKYELAVKYFQYYRDNISYSPNQDLSFFSAYGLGMTYAEKKDCELALTYINQAHQMNGPLDYNSELYKRKASCLIELNRLDEAEQALVAAEEIHNSLPELKGTKWDIETIKIRGALAQASGDKDLGFALTNQYYQTYIDLLLKNTGARLVSVRAAMELERQNVEYVLLEQRNKVQALLVEQQRQKNMVQGYVIAFAFFVILAIFTALVIQGRTKDKILAMSIRDELSGLYNRRFAFNYIDKLLVHVTPGKTELHIVMIDIDDFKKINDTYGHPFGDEVIKAVAEIGREILRADDIMARIGGEEFLCVLPRLSEQECTAIVQRFREKINARQLTTETGEVISITVSIGIASVDEHCFDTQNLYANVDKALYQAKAQGKNRIVNFHQQWSSTVSD